MGKIKDENPRTAKMNMQPHLSNRLCGHLTYLIDATVRVKMEEAK